MTSRNIAKVLILAIATLLLVPHSFLTAQNPDDDFFVELDPSLELRGDPAEKDQAFYVGGQILGSNAACQSVEFDATQERHIPSPVLELPPLLQDGYSISNDTVLLNGEIAFVGASESPDAEPTEIQATVWYHNDPENPISIPCPFATCSSGIAQASENGFFLVGSLSTYVIQDIGGGTASLPHSGTALGQSVNEDASVVGGADTNVGPVLWHGDGQSYSSPIPLEDPTDFFAIGEVDGIAGNWAVAEMINMSAQVHVGIWDTDGNFIRDLGRGNSPRVVETDGAKYVAFTGWNGSENEAFVFQEGNQSAEPLEQFLAGHGLDIGDQGFESLDRIIGVGKGTICFSGVGTKDGEDANFFARIFFDLGDVNHDGDINLLDVAPFVQLITSGTYQTQGDINEDGAVNLLDVGPFVQLLTGG